MEFEERMAIVNQIGDLAAKLGSDIVIENTGDAEEHENQVHIGLAEAVALTLRMKPKNLTYWLGFCVAKMGYDPNVERFEAVRDELDNFFKTEERETPPEPYE